MFFFKLYVYDTNVDNSPLVGSTHQGVHIDNCPWTCITKDKTIMVVGICFVAIVATRTPFQQVTTLDVLESI